MAEVKGAASDQLRKITMKAIGFKADMEKLIKAKDKRIDIAQIFGVVRKSKPDVDDQGKEYIRFYGQFKAVNMETGEVYQAAQAILPGIVQDALHGALGGDVQSVQFAVQIGYKYAPENKGAVKYSYTCANLLPTQENDPLTLLENSLKSSGTLALADKTGKK